MEISRHLIETEVYAYIMRHFFDNEGYYSILLKEDATLKKAVEVINKNIWKPEVFIQHKESETETEKLSSSYKSARHNKIEMIASL